MAVVMVIGMCVVSVSAATVDGINNAVNGGTITLDADLVLDDQVIIRDGKTITIDLNGNKLTFDENISTTVAASVNAENFGAVHISGGANVTFKNGTIDISGVDYDTRPGNHNGLIFVGGANTVLTFDNVQLVGENYSTTGVIFASGASKIVFQNGSSINLSGETNTGSAGVLSNTDGTGTLELTDTTVELADAVRGMTGFAITLTDSEITMTGNNDQYFGNGINNSSLNMSGSAVTIDGLSGRGLTIAGGTSAISENSTLNVTNCTEANINTEKYNSNNNNKLVIDNTSEVTADSIDDVANIENNNPNLIIDANGRISLKSPRGFGWIAILLMLKSRIYDVAVETVDGGVIASETEIEDGVAAVRRMKDFTFTVTANEGYKLVSVLVDGEDVGAVETYTIENIKEDHTVSAVFEKLETADEAVADAE